MKYSESWLREWVNPTLKREKLSERLTMAGLEVEDIQPAAVNFSNVIIGKIIEIIPHPNADLKLCTVAVAKNQNLQIVCGAKNAALNMKVAVANIGAELPGDVSIQETSIRGVTSQGMICSAKELGLSEESETIIELPADAPLGQDLRRYFALQDFVFDISITPNRGDCLSIKGLAREISALTKARLNELKIKKIKSTCKDSLKISVEDKIGTPNYVGRVIKNVRADAKTPIWLAERLRRSGVRSISPIVDVTNYVMLELGQPMHAFDLDKIDAEIKVRISRAGESIALLDGSTVTLNASTMLIADKEKPLAIAGVMGGLDSSVSLLTKNIFLESAYFTPQVVARQRQRYNLDSESAYRFERGIDPTIQEQAIERATDLITQICGGEPGPVSIKTKRKELPKTITIKLSQAKVGKVLGIHIASQEIEEILKGLHFVLKKNKGKEISWQVSVPAYRTDITLPEDLIEEIARLYGYNKIPTHSINASLFVNTKAPEELNLQELRNQLSTLGYQEIISYSFINKKLQGLLDPLSDAEELLNPISSDMAVMRTNLWPGLLATLKYNLARQNLNFKLFEVGTCFVKKANQVSQEQRLGGILTGTGFPEQWAIPSREIDFYDIKGQLEEVIGKVYPIEELEFKTANHPSLHPRQSASVHYEGKCLGQFGRLHPKLLTELDLDAPVFLFELDLDLFKNKAKPIIEEISKFPEIRRDLALLVNQAIPAKDIQDTIRKYAGDWLKDVFIFDVYQGKGITPGLKSIALAVILQHPARTLIDTEVAELMERVVTALKEKLGAELRS